MLVNTRHHVRARLDHFSQDVFLPHDLQVIQQVRRGRHGIRQRRQIRDAPDRFELLLIFEPLLQSDYINGFFAIVHLDQLIENRLVAEIIKNLRIAFQFFDAFSRAT